MSTFVQRSFLGLMITCASAAATTGHAQELFGNYTDDPGSSDHRPNFLLGQQITVTENFNLTDVGLIVDGNNGGSAMANIGVYTDNAGLPDILVAETGVFNLGLGDQRVPVVSPTALPAGDYWYMAVYDRNVNISQDDGVFEFTYFRTHDAGAALPSQLTSFLDDYFDKLFNYYLVASDVVTPGDFNGDGNVDGADFLEWQRDPGVGSLAVWEANYGTPIPQLAGDFNGNGIVDGEDFLLWQRDPSIGSLADWEVNYGMVAPLSASSAAVPEPTTCTLALAALCLAMSRRRAL